MVFFRRCIRFFPIFRSLPNEHFIEDILDRDVSNYVQWFGRSFSALLYEDTNNKISVRNGRNQGKRGSGGWLPEQFFRTTPSRTSEKPLFKTEYHLI